MLDLANDIRSLSDFKRKTTELLDHIKRTGHPLVLTINGRAEASLIALALDPPAKTRKRSERAATLAESAPIDESLLEDVMERYNTSTGVVTGPCPAVVSRLRATARLSGSENVVGGHA